MTSGTLSGLAQSLSESVTALVQREGGWVGDAGWSTLGASALGSVKLVISFVLALQLDTVQGSR